MDGEGAEPVGWNGSSGRIEDAGVSIATARSRVGSASGAFRFHIASGPDHDAFSPVLVFARSRPMERGGGACRLVDPGRDHARRRSGPQDPGHIPGSEGDCRHDGTSGCSSCSGRSRQHAVRDEERGDRTPPG